MIVLIPNSILNTFLSGKVRYLLRKLDFCYATSEPGQKYCSAYKKKACISWLPKNQCSILHLWFTPLNKSWWVSKIGMKYMGKSNLRLPGITTGGFLSNNVLISLCPQFRIFVLIILRYTITVWKSGFKAVIQSKKFRLCFFTYRNSVCVRHFLMTNFPLNQFN